MKLALPQPALAAVISKGGAVAPKSSPAPILNHLRLRAEGDFLSVASSDLDRFADSKSPAQVETEGETTVNAAALAALIGRLPRDKDVLLEIEDGHLIVKCGRSRSKLPTLPAADFPKWVDGKDAVEFTIEGQALADHLGRVRPMTEVTGVIRPILQGVRLHRAGDVVAFSATNGNVGAYSTLETDTPEFPAVIVPNETVDAVLRVFKGEQEVTISASKNVVTFSNYAHRIGSKVIEGVDNFPNVAFLTNELPAEKIARVNRVDLAQAVERAVLGAAKEGQWAFVVLIPREDGLEIKGSNLDGNEVRDNVAAEIEEGFKFAAFSPRYLSSILATAPDDEIEIVQAENGLNHVVRTPGEPSYVAGLAALRSNAAMGE